MEHEQVCCPRFNPDQWDGKEIVWKDKLFLRDRVISFLHIPLNFGSVMKKNMSLIEATGAKSEDVLVLSDENSMWGADVYISVAREVPGRRVVTLSGTFFCRVFEGPYSRVGVWVQEMTHTIAEKGKQLGKLYFYYTTCPKCAKKYGKNYVVLLAQI